MRKYTHLSYEERIRLEILLSQGASLRSVARTLGRSPNTLSREIREKEVKGVYVPKKAHHKTYWRRYRSKQNCMKVAMSRELTALVKEKILLGWSPERIAGYARRNGTALSKKAIYRFVRSRCMEHHLFWHRHCVRGGPKRRHRGVRDTDKRPISERPPILGSGHVEIDFIVSRQSPAVLMVVVDRWTRLTTLRRLERKTHRGVLGALQEMCRHRRIITITTDNDIVFRKWKEMEKAVKIPFFFTPPYHSWEKGLVENTNRWIRCFVPKRRDMSTVSDDELHSIEAFLNETPRQCLGYRTAMEVYLSTTEVS
jgi:transposase, IS30 family